MTGAYKPNILIDNIELLSEEQWLKIRRNGIGGSDAGVVMNASSFKTIQELYWDKTNEYIKKPDNYVALEVGHLLEPLVAKIFISKNPDYRLIETNSMYYHPNYPWMLADLDYLVQNIKTGKIYILECKTTGSLKAWGSIHSEDCPESYKWQVRHYMSVTNLDGAFLCVLCGNTIEGYRQRFIPRDKKLEYDLINAERNFWLRVLNHNPPAITDPRTALIVKERYQLSEEVINLHVDNELKVFLELKKKKDDLKDKVKELKDNIEAIKEQEDIIIAQIFEKLKGKKGLIEDGENFFDAFIEEKEKFSIPSSDLPNLKLSNPEVYERYVKKTTSKSFKLVPHK